jgi:hypothetical protein
MNTNSNERPTAVELYSTFEFWYYSITGTRDDEEKFGYKRKQLGSI